MEAFSCTGQCNSNDKDLEELLQVFGNGFSLEDIASAYCKAKCNKEVASEILCDMFGTMSTNNMPDCLESEKEASLKLHTKWDNGRAVPMEQSSYNVLGKASDGGKNTPELKSKKCPASMGTVSSIIGKDYVKTKPSSSGFIEVKKPLRLDSKDVPPSELWGGKNAQDIAAKDVTMQASLEEFLFQMLGEGFNLDSNVIREVLGLCGYDVQKSIDKLLNLSASAFEKHHDTKGMSNSIDQCSDQESPSQLLDSAQSDGAGVEARSMDSLESNDMVDVQKEVLEALFNVPDRSEEAPKRVRIVRPVFKRRSRAFGKLVVEPFKDTDEPAKLVAKPCLVTKKEAEDDGNSYDDLRVAAKEYWTTMREYYKAAVEAFMNGDHTRAHKLLQQGQFFNQKAREADEISCQKLIETKCGDNEEEEVNDDNTLSLDLRGFDPKESLRLLRRHLTSVSGIPTIKYLRVVLENNEEDRSKKGACRRLVIKQLEKESIKWTEEADGEVIVIRVDVIDPKRLSFAEKYGVGDHGRVLPKYCSSRYYF